MRTKSIILLAVCLLAVGWLLFWAAPGEQACRDGACCAGGQMCLTPACTVDSDCPRDLFGAWSECAGSGDACAVDGIQGRTAVSFACEGGMCRTREREDTRACERPTDGLACDDGNACTVDDRCGDGACQGQARRCDDGDACTADTCTAALGCVHEPVRACPGPRSACKNAGAACDTGNACERGEIRCAGGRPRCVAVGLADASTVCRPARGPCDLTEHCTGTSADCPADRLASAESVCRQPAGPCDLAQLCTGAGPDCPADTLLAGGSLCPPGPGECDVAEMCTESSAACAADDEGCDAGEYCLVATCWPRPTIAIEGGTQGRDGARCSDLERARHDGSGLRVVIQGRPHALFRYMRRHASCAGSLFIEESDLPCGEGTVGQLDAGGTCTLTIREPASGAACPDRTAGRWEVYVAIDGQLSTSAFIDIHDSSPTCADNPRTCEAAAYFCPFTGACNDESCATGDRGEPVLSSSLESDAVVSRQKAK